MYHKIGDIFKLLRVKQWIKNLFVFAPLIFAVKFLYLAPLLHSLYAFGWFCIASSFIYTINDIFDVEEDRKHPLKSKTRPLASGELSMASAYRILVVLFIILLPGFWVLPKVLGVIVGYILINIAYSVKLKHVPVIDIFVISIGFVLRVYAGALAIDVPLSSWMFVTTLSLALFLAAMKRRQELQTNGEEGRKVLSNYSISLLDKFASIAATGCLVFYSLFVMSEKEQMAVTLPFVLYGLFRYWYIVDQEGGGESPTDVVYNDRHIAVTVILWILSCVYVLWPGNF